MSGEEGGFLARWSRRKRAAEAGEPPPEPEAVEAPVPQAEAPPAAPAEAAPPEPEFDLASLPKIEELTVETDVSVFLRPGVPQALRTAALRRIWSLDAGIRDYIGPVDYQWDFNTPGGLPFGFANELGGEVKKLLAQAIGELEEQQARTAEAPPAKPDAPESQAGEEAPEPAPAPEVPVAEAQPEELPAPQPEAEPPPPPRRRHGGALPA